MDTTHSANRLTARSERREEWAQIPFFHFLFHFSPFQPHMYSPLSFFFAFIFLQAKAENTSLAFSPFFLIPSFHPCPAIHFFYLYFSVFMSFLAEVQLVLLISSPITLSERNTAKLISWGKWQPETMRWWVHRWAAWTSWVIRQIPAFLWLHVMSLALEMFYTRHTVLLSKHWLSKLSQIVPDTLNLVKVCVPSDTVPPIFIVLYTGQPMVVMVSTTPKENVFSVAFTKMFSI